MFIPNGEVTSCPPTTSPAPYHHQTSTDLLAATMAVVCSRKCWASSDERLGGGLPQSNLVLRDALAQHDVARLHQGY
ncbi:hypothetical protein E2C01_065930 [Portunus trituberculatus]|uniref:Uncharacterized protein n=1 Tax=Portunus trituberculatus TaxID=210409 RepID=A0A5B7HNX6_PORTR|nr:hypothetical protein [Portunus trituberculatus]